MVKVDKEKFIAGSDEIDRQRNICVRMFSIIQPFVQEHEKKCKWNEDDIVAEADLGEFGIMRFIGRGGTFVQSRYLELRHVSPPHDSRNYILYSNYAQDIRSLPYKVIPVLFNKLDLIYEQIIMNCPDIGFKEYVSYFMSMASKE